MATFEKEKEIKKLMDTLNISRQEAVELLAFDNEETDNEEVDEIEKKVKSADTSKSGKTTKKGSSLDKVKNQKAKKKADAVKDEIVNAIKFFVKNGSAEIFQNPQDMTASKITFTAKDGSFFSISITKHKAKPDGYEVAGE